MKLFAILLLSAVALLAVETRPSRGMPATFHPFEELMLETEEQKLELKALQTQFESASMSVMRADPDNNAESDNKMIVCKRMDEMLSMLHAIPLRYSRMINFLDMAMKQTENVQMNNTLLRARNQLKSQLRDFTTDMLKDGIATFARSGPIRSPSQFLYNLFNTDSGTLEKHEKLSEETWTDYGRKFAHSLPDVDVPYY
ncbi:hypothetical protein Ciccas_007206 [Cichlidogyrus casuarinus]|uniref:Uncharacterized protein n=1 Tax=Cichlidogyrus casuarinus TaxID=1844966 RepID=A0ABD2Q3P0_9PLAT